MATNKVCTKHSIFNAKVNANVDEMNECDALMLNNIDAQVLNKGMIPRLIDGPTISKPRGVGREGKVGSEKFRPWDPWCCSY